jgi:hypothetical protein
MGTFQGPWRIIVVNVDSDFPQRAVVRTRNGTTVIPGRLHASHQVDAGTWQLSLEHHRDGTWRPNVRALTSSSTDDSGMETRLIRSKDHDWPHDTLERNLVLRLERLGARDEPVTEARSGQTTTQSAGAVFEQATRSSAYRATTSSERFTDAPATPSTPTTSTAPSLPSVTRTTSSSSW